MIKKCAVALALATVAIPNIVGAAEMRARQLSFDELDGWQSDDHDAALATFATTCDLIDAHCCPAHIRQVRAGSTLKRVQPLVQG